MEQIGLTITINGFLKRKFPVDEKILTSILQFTFSTRLFRNLHVIACIDIHISGFSLQYNLYYNTW